MQKEQKVNLYIILIALSIYTINRFTSLFSSIPYVGYVFRYHFNDYLGAIVFISYVNILLIRKNFQTFTTVPALLFWGAVCSIFWEGIAPCFLSYSTPDWLDYIAYFLGMFTYGWILRGISSP